MNEMGLFGVSFLFVFALSFQQQNIHRQRYVFALINAAFIAALNLFVVRLGAQASPTEIFAFIAGQPLGTVAAMWLNSHPLVVNIRLSQSAKLDREPHG